MSSKDDWGIAIDSARSYLRRRGVPEGELDDAVQGGCLRVLLHVRKGGAVHRLSELLGTASLNRWRSSLGRIQPRFDSSEVWANEPTSVGPDPGPYDDLLENLVGALDRLGPYRGDLAPRAQKVRRHRARRRLGKILLEMGRQT